MPRKRKHKRKVDTLPAYAPANADSYYELEVIPGLAEFAQAELQERMGGKVRLLPGALNGTVASTMMSLARPSPDDRVVSIKLPANTRAGYIRPRLYLLHRR
jgi:hypothetical protein